MIAMGNDIEDLGHLPPASKVEALAGFSLSADEIARVLDVDAALIKSAFAKELESGALKANARVAESLYRKALGDGREAVTAAIFWLKTRARWKETFAAEVTHDVADPLAALMQRIAIEGRRLHDGDSGGSLRSPESDSHDDRT